VALTPVAPVGLSLIFVYSHHIALLLGILVMPAVPVWVHPGVIPEFVGKTMDFFPLTDNFWGGLGLIWRIDLQEYVA